MPFLGLDPLPARLYPDCQVRNLDLAGCLNTYKRKIMMPMNETEKEIYEKRELKETHGEEYT
jgi:hypothetical protein